MRLCWSIIFLVYAVSALIHKGSMDIHKIRKGHYLEKFCFDYDSSGETAGLYSFSYKIDWVPKVVPKPSIPPSENQTPAKTQSPNMFAPGVYLAIYDDREEKWEDTWQKWDSLSCQKKLENASLAQMLRPTKLEDKKTVDAGVRQIWRPRFWYFTIVACDTEILSPLTYTLHMKNIKRGFQEEESMERLNLIYFAISSIMISLIALLTYGSVFLSRIVDSCKKNQVDKPAAMHPLYVIGVVCWLTFLVGGVLEAIYRAKALDGVSVDPVGLLFFSDVIETFGRGMMLILCILVANGWTFVGSEDGLSLSTIVALQLSVVIQIGCELMALIQQKPESSYTPYNGFWGMIAICIQMVIILTYIFNMHYTYNYRIYPQQKPFFLAFGLSTVAWCLALPTLFLIEEWCYPWERERILRFVEGCGRLVTMALISFWLHPTNLDSHIYFKPVVEQESRSVVPVERKQRTLKIGAGGIAYEDDDKYSPPLPVDASQPQQEIELAGWNAGISPSAGQRFM